MADLRKAELFPADAFGLFYLHQPALRGVRRQSTSLLYSSTGWPSAISFFPIFKKSATALKNQRSRSPRLNISVCSMFVVCKSCAVYIVNPAALFFAAKKSKSRMDILHNFSPFFTSQDWFDAPYFMICNKTTNSVARCAKKTEKDLCGIFLTIVIYYLQ